MTPKFALIKFVRAAVPWFEDTFSAQSSVKFFVQWAATLTPLDPEYSKRNSRPHPLLPPRSFSRPALLSIPRERQRLWSLTNACPAFSMSSFSRHHHRIGFLVRCSQPSILFSSFLTSSYEGPSSQRNIEEERFLKVFFTDLGLVNSLGRRKTDWMFESLEGLMAVIVGSTSNIRAESHEWQILFGISWFQSAFLSSMFLRFSINRVDRISSWKSFWLSFLLEKCSGAKKSNSNNLPVEHIACSQAVSMIMVSQRIIPKLLASLLASCKRQSFSATAAKIAEKFAL